MERLLVTTALEDTWGQDEHLVFLGEWCRLYDRRNVWGDRSHEICSYHWADREKLKVDHAYLQKLYERSLTALIGYLNDVHQTSYPTRYWRIIVGPWLLTFISIVWDRWENLRLAFKKQTFDKTFFLSVDPFSLIPKDYSQFTSFFQHHLWNHYIFSEIIKFQYSNHILIQELSCNEDEFSFMQRGRKSTKSKSLLRYITHSIQWFSDKIIDSIQPNQDIAFVVSYFDFLSLVQLNLHLGQLPRFYSEFDQNLILKEIHSYRRDSRLEDIREHFGNVENDFENFWVDFLVKQIPNSYLEHFSTIRELSSNFIKKPKLVFTANAHWGNELFKVWLSEGLLQKGKFIVTAHGGAIPAKFTSFNHENSIASTLVSWHVPTIGKEVKLSPNKLIRIIRGNTFRKFIFWVSSKPKDITLVSLEAPLYSYRCQSAPMAGLGLEDYQQKKDFVDFLNDKALENLKIRLYPHEMGLNIRQRYIDDFGVEKISPYRRLRQAIVNSCIVVCTYPQTTFAEAMSSGVPTILLYLPKYWETHPAFDCLIHQLIDAGIVYSDACQAAEHVNQIYENPCVWWNASRTVEAREMFFDMCGRVRDDWMKEWSSFFKKELY